MQRDGLTRRDAVKAAGIGISSLAATGILGARAAAGASSGVGAAQPSTPASPKQNAPVPTTGGIAAGPTPNGEQAFGHYRFKVGENVQAWSISDGTGRFSPLQPLVAPQASPEQFKQVLEENLADPTGATIAFNVVLLKLGAETVLIDSGSGEREAAQTGWLLKNLAQAGVKPSDITGVVITHAHGDHIQGLFKSDDRLVFPNARVFVHTNEHDFWTGNPDLSKMGVPEQARAGMSAAAAKAFATLRKEGKLELIKGGDKLVGGLTIVDTPGHTPGHISVVVDAPGAGGPLFVMSDIVHHHVAMFARPEWTIAFDTDPTLAVQTRRRVFDMIVSEKMRAHGYHMPWPGLGRIGRRGEGYWWGIEGWTWS
ncbi:MAG: MBL fold metallo-hydrolase [Planctomycetota bacterium]|nr:MBL fold metallo-hydrolase [Planctomycetota bacterium]